MLIMRLLESSCRPRFRWKMQSNQQRMRCGWGAPERKVAVFDDRPMGGKSRHRAPRGADKDLHDAVGSGKSRARLGCPHCLAHDDGFTPIDEYLPRVTARPNQCRLVARALPNWSEHRSPRHAVRWSGDVREISVAVFDERRFVLIERFDAERKAIEAASDLWQCAHMRIGGGEQ